MYTDEDLLMSARLFVNIRWKEGGDLLLMINFHFVAIF